MEPAQLSQATFARPEGAPGSLNALLRVFAIPVAGFFLFGVGVASGIRSDRIGLFGLAIATGSLILTVVAVDRTRPRERRNLLLSVLSFSYFVRFVFPALFFYVGDAGYEPEISPSPIPLTPNAVTYGSFMALVGYAMLLAGYALPIGGFTAKALPRMRREWTTGAALSVALVTILLGWVVLLASMFGLIPERAGSGVLGTIASGTTIGIALIALCHQRYRSPFALLLLILVIPPTMFFNFFTSMKSLFLMPLVMVVLVHVVLTRRLSAWWIAGFLAVMATVYPMAKIYREYMLENSLTTMQVLLQPQRVGALIKGVAATSDPITYLQSGLQVTAVRLDGLGILSVIARDAGTRVPFQGGWSLAYIPMTYVPRVIWPDKPKFEVGIWVTENFGSGPGILSSTGCTWMGQFYFCYGWIGVIIGMVALGVWCRFLQDYFLRLDATIPSMVVGVVTILTLAAGLESDLLAPTSGLVVRVAPIFFAHLGVILITPPPAKPPPPL